MDQGLVTLAPQITNATTAAQGTAEKPVKRDPR
jgi:hypothetical protein